MVQHGRAEIALALISLSSENHLTISEIALKTIESGIVHDPHEMLAFLGVIAKQFPERFLQFRQEFILNIFMQHQVIRRDTSLPGIQAFSPCHPLGSHFDIRIFVDYARAFSA